MLNDSEAIITFMGEAVEEAKKAFKKGEVPVGAVVVSPEGITIGKGHNLKEYLKDPCAHAEILAIREAAKRIGDWRLNGCALFVTLEPCLMCCGAIIQARVSYLFYGARDPKFGAVESVINSLSMNWNHKVQVCGGIEEERCRRLLQDFFKRLRGRQ